MAGADFAESARCPNHASRSTVSLTQTDEDRQVLIPGVEFVLAVAHNSSPVYGTRTSFPFDAAGVRPFLAGAGVDARLTQE